MSVLSLPTNASVAQQATARYASRMQLEALWQQHAEYVYTLALRLMANADEADSLTVEVFQCAQQQWPELQGDERRRLLQWTMGLALSWLRRQARLLVPRDNAPLKISANASRQPVYPDPVELEKRILQLPDYGRVVFVLRAVMDLDKEEIAAYLRTDEGRIREALHRARLALRDSLREEKT